MTEELKLLANDIEAAIGKGHRGYTIRHEQMYWVIRALRILAETQTPSAKRSPIEAMLPPYEVTSSHASE